MKKTFVILCFVIVSLFVIASRQTLWAQGQEKEQEGLKARCATSADCSRPGMIGFCQDAGAKTARCLWQEIVKVPAIVIEPQTCRSCQTKNVVERLGMLFPGLDVEYLKADDQKAKNLMDEMKINILPAYILGKEAEREGSFADFQKMAVFINGQYYLKPEFSGVSYFLQRPVEKKRLDVFLVLTASGMQPSAKIAYDVQKNKKENITVKVHFLGIEDAKTKKIISPGSDREAAEEKVYACVEKYYPDQAWDYLMDRLANPSDIWIDDNLLGRKFDVKKIKGCAKGGEGERLLKDKVRLSQELEVSYAPLFLMENVEIFGVTEKTTAKEVVEILKGQ